MIPHDVVLDVLERSVPAAADVDHGDNLEPPSDARKPLPGCKGATLESPDGRLLVEEYGLEEALSIRCDVDGGKVVSPADHFHDIRVSITLTIRCS
jgi:hypothetical protein